MPSPSLDSWLTRVAERDRAHLAAVRTAGHHRERLADAVARARGAGASWQDIADALHVTKHAAHKRFTDAPDRVVDPAQRILFDR